MPGFEDQSDGPKRGEAHYVMLTITKEHYSAMGWKSRADVSAWIHGIMLPKVAAIRTNDVAARLTETDQKLEELRRLRDGGL